MNFDFSFALLGGATPSTGRKLFSNKHASLSNDKKINKLSQKKKPFSMNYKQTNDSSAVSVVPLKENMFTHGASRKSSKNKYEPKNQNSEKCSLNAEGKVCAALSQGQSPQTKENWNPQFVDLSKVSLRRHQRKNLKTTHRGTVEDTGSEDTVDKRGLCSCAAVEDECTARSDTALKLNIKRPDDEINHCCLINTSVLTKNQNGDKRNGRRQLPFDSSQNSRSMRVSSSLPRGNTDSPLLESCTHLVPETRKSGVNMDYSADSSIIVYKRSLPKCISETSDSSVNESSDHSFPSTPGIGPLISEQVSKMGNILIDISLGKNYDSSDSKEIMKVGRSLDSDIVESSITEGYVQPIKSKRKKEKCVKLRGESNTEGKFQVINQNFRNVDAYQKTFVFDLTLSSDDDVVKLCKQNVECKTVRPDLSLWKSGTESPTDRLKNSMAAFDSVQRWLIKSHSEESIILLSSDTDSPYATPLLTNELQRKTESMRRQHSTARPGLNSDEMFLTPHTSKAEDSKTSTQHCAPSATHSAEMEDVLDSLYGSEWRGQDVLTLSEPRPVTKRGLMKQLRTRSERPKQSKKACSSSSEDEFDVFCRNLEQRKTLFSSTRRFRLDSVGRSDDELIGDYESGDSAEFFRGLVNSLHKSLPKKCELGNGTVEKTPRQQKNVRRLSFHNSDSETSVHKRDKNKKQTTGILTASTGARRRSLTKSSRSTRGTSIAKKQMTSSSKDLTKLNDKCRTRSVGPARDLDGKPVARQLVMSIGQADDVGRTVFKFPKPLAISDENEKSRPMTTTNTPAKNSNGPVLSFLSSLSVEIGSMRCHPESVIYKQKFKAKKEELCRRLFDLYNKEVFENKLDSGTPLEWNARMRRTGGFCYMRRVFETDKGYKRTARIVLSSKVLDSPDRLRDTLIHEMCHAAAWVVTGLKDGHGPVWKEWTNKAMERFPELPPIKRCHAYAITTKFTYKCTSCGYGYNRHSKSVDVNRKRCGFCHGKLMLIVNNSGGGAGPNEAGGGKPKPPRAPSAFALYVKHNYRAAKTHNKHLKHGDLMRLLGQQFTAMKIVPAT